MHPSALTDVDDEMERGEWRGVGVGGKKIYTLAYADDTVVLTEEKKGMRGMMGKLERYLGRIGLELNTGKTKVKRCRKGGGTKVVERKNNRESKRIYLFRIRDEI